MLSLCLTQTTITTPNWAHCFHTVSSHSDLLPIIISKWSFQAMMSPTVHPYSSGFIIKTYIINLGYIPWFLDDFLGSELLGITFFPWLFSALLSISYPNILFRLFLFLGFVPPLPNLPLSILQIQNTLSIKKNQQSLSHLLTYGQRGKPMLTM